MNKKVSEDDKRMTMQLYVSNDKGSLKTTENFFHQDGYFGNQRSDLTLLKANFPENLLAYVNQSSISTLKNDDKAIYTVNVALAQILPLVNSPLNIDEYECAEDEVKLLCPLYDTQTGQFLGLEKDLQLFQLEGI